MIAHTAGLCSNFLSDAPPPVLCSSIDSSLSTLSIDLAMSFAAYVELELEVDSAFWSLLYERDGSSTEATESLSTSR
jgi:hypothetical protein